MKGGKLMDYDGFLKLEIEKTIYIEFKKDMSFNSDMVFVLPEGFYPILPKDMVSIAKEGSGSIPLQVIIDGMLYMIACDRQFKYNESYIECLKKVENIKNYIIMKIEKSRSNFHKTAIIYATALSELYPSRTNDLNRIYELVEYSKINPSEFIDEEIKYSLEKAIKDYPDYTPTCLYLAEYYINSDRDRAKMLLNKAITNPESSVRASELLERIRLVEDYDKAVEKVKQGRGSEALETLKGVLENNKDNPDVRYYTSVALRQCGDYEGALEMLEELVKNCALPEVLSEAGLNYAFIGDFNEALKSFQQALEMKPKDPEILCNIGVCRLNLGQLDEAKGAINKAHALNPKDEIINTWLEQIKQIK
jgi:Flp pilus assembly protein TadD